VRGANWKKAALGELHEWAKRGHQNKASTAGGEREEGCALDPKRKLVEETTNSKQGVGNRGVRGKNGKGRTWSLGRKPEETGKDKVRKRKCERKGNTRGKNSGEKLTKRALNFTS